MQKKREEAVKVAQEKAEHEQTQRATKRRDAEKFSIKQQMKVCSVVLRLVILEPVVFTM